MPTRSRLNALVDAQVSDSIVSTLSRTVDRMADLMAEELLRDPQVRADLQRLVKDAFKRAVDALNDAASGDPR